MYARNPAKPFTNISSLNPKTTVSFGYCCYAHFTDKNSKVHMASYIGQGHTAGRFPKSGFEPEQSDSRACAFNHYLHEKGSGT